MDNKYYIPLDRAVINVSGADAYKLLQGIITNDLGKVSAAQAIYAYLLTPQGKYLYDFFISGNKDNYYIEIASADAESFLKKLKMYKLRSDVLIKDVSNDLAVYSIIENSGLAAGSFYSDPRSPGIGIRAILNKKTAEEEFKSKNYRKENISRYDEMRIENNIPEGESDLEKDKSYPLQYRMIELNGVDFKKGCYVGQEVTARTHHRGVIRKTVYRIESEGAISAEKGAEIKAGDEKAGMLLSVKGNNGLAILETEAVLKKPETLHINDMKLNVI